MLSEEQLINYAAKGVALKKGESLSIPDASIQAVAGIWLGVCQLRKDKGLPTCTINYKTKTIQA